MLNINAWEKAKKEGFSTFPFDHIIIDDFFKPEIADKLAQEFPDFNEPAWREYNNPIEIKRLLNSWDKFPETTYQAFYNLCGKNFIDELEKLTGLVLQPDYGLNGGGWHIHGKGGKLNVHLDYSLHPKLPCERKLNLIVYLSKDWEKEWRGDLQLWSNNTEKKQPLKCEKSIDIKFNRAVIFDTTQNSWHGLPDIIDCPEGVFRKSIALYYLTEPGESAVDRSKALFAPYGDQKDDPEVLKLIEKRSNVNSAASVYGDKK